MDELSENPPTDIDPYTVLEVTSSADSNEIRSAYKKLALRHHPDKVPSHSKESAHLTFQRIAFAYAILSSPQRRRRYDTTGSTSESIDADDDFNWADFFRTQFSEALTADKFHSFAASYKSSEEEKRDVLGAYVKHQGKLNGVYNDVMLSNPLEDETRFREYIDGAIAAGEVEKYDKYVNETKKSKDARMRKARNEAKEAEKEAQGNEKYKSIFGGDGDKSGKNEKGKVNGEAALAELIQAKNKGQAQSFLDGLEQKYAGEQRGKKGVMKEPPEEAFQMKKEEQAAEDKKPITDKKRGRKRKAEEEQEPEPPKKKPQRAATKRANAEKSKKVEIDEDEDEHEVLIGLDYDEPSAQSSDELVHELEEKEASPDPKPKPKPTPKRGRPKKAQAQAQAKSPVAKPQRSRRGRK
ncbi:MAG: hypothetical protein Q9190_001835 [Brigantiaea leucoxantha]